MKVRNLAALILFITLGSGCVMIGANKEYHPFDSGVLKELDPGKTTASEVLDMLGAPSQVVELSNGNAYIYNRSLAKGTVLWLFVVSLGNYDKQFDRIVFFFNDKNLLMHYGVSLHADKATYALPF